MTETVVKRQILKSPQPSLKQAWSDFRKENPDVRIRVAARKLGVTELELVAVRCGETNIRLRPDWDALIPELESLGPVMALTRNDAVVHETHGVFSDMRKHGSVGMFFTPGIDTRFFLGRWKSAFAVNENQRLSLQFFDEFGVAAHKAYVTDRTNKLAYEKLVRRFRSENQLESQVVKVPATRLSKQITLNEAELRKSWLAITDVHEGPRLVQANGGSYPVVYEALGEELARPLNPWAVELLLQRLSDARLSSMIFVMNKSAIQAYSGPVKKLLRTGPWFNVLDPKFNLHLKTSEIGQAWYVRKPSDDGWVTTMHVFDRHGREILLLADDRVRGQKESSSWREALWSIAEENPLA